MNIGERVGRVVGRVGNRKKQNKTECLGCFYPSILVPLLSDLVFWDSGTPVFASMGARNITRNAHPTTAATRPCAAPALKVLKDKLAVILQLAAAAETAGWKLPSGRLPQSTKKVVIERNAKLVSFARELHRVLVKATALGTALRKKRAGNGGGVQIRPLLLPAGPRDEAAVEVEERPGR